MAADNFLKILKSFNWSILQKTYGSAHSSIIGFISSEWIKQSIKENSIVDGAPAVPIGQGRSGQKNADILLCKGEKLLIVVEVETQVSNYPDKIKTIEKYFKDFEGLDFGLLVMLNLCKGDKKYKHNWDSIKEKVRHNNYNIALVSIEKEKAIRQSNDSVLGKLRKRNAYYRWEINKIDYWVHSVNHIPQEGNLWNKT